MTALQSVNLQRTQGALRLRFACVDGISRPIETFQAGAMRVRFPHTAPGCKSEAVVMNTAGGLTGGDRLDIRIEAGREAQVVLCSQACEKIYRSASDRVRIATELVLKERANVDWLPQPCILFDHAQLDRQMEISMAGDATLLALESCILGRTAMKESITQGRLRDGWRVKRAERLIYADQLILNGADLRDLEKPWAFDGRLAYASLLYVAPEAQNRICEMREILKACRSRGAASSWDGLLLTRLLADDGYALTADLVRILSVFRKATLPRLWSI